MQAQYEECDPNAPLQVSGKVCSKACKLEDKPIYDLALTKTLATLSAVLQSGAHVQIPAYKPGDAVKFKITVYNQGTLPAKDIQVTEYIPRGLLLNDTNWQQQGTFATRWIRDTILPGKKIEL